MSGSTLTRLNRLNSVFAKYLHDTPDAGIQIQ